MLKLSFGSVFFVFFVVSFKKDNEKFPILVYFL